MYPSWARVLARLQPPHPGTRRLQPLPPTQLGHTVVKAFNDIYASHLLTEGRPSGSPGRMAPPLAGDDPTAKAVVIDLLDELGFAGVDAGPLEESWGASSQVLPPVAATAGET
jgi:predicted dinucleotide-binding enzyme